MFRRNPYHKPICPNPLSLPASCLLAGLAVGFLGGLAFSYILRRVLGLS